MLLLSFENLNIFMGQHHGIHPIENPCTGSGTQYFELSSLKIFYRASKISSLGKLT